MPHRIVLTQYIEEPTQGASGLRVLVFAEANFQRYFVKCVSKDWAESHPNAVRQLANEYICARIASKLGLCCPIGEICELSESVKQEQACLGIMEGPYFGSKEVPNDGCFNSELFPLQECANERFFALLVLFESFICNSDMQDRNVLKGKDQNLWVIDHAGSFGGSWGEDPAIDCDQRLLVGTNDSFKCARLLVNVTSKKLKNGSTLFEEFRHKVDDEFVNLIVDETPPEWISTSQKDKLKKILQCRRRKLEELIPLQDQ